MTHMKTMKAVQRITGMTLRDCLLFIREAPADVAAWLKGLDRLFDEDEIEKLEGLLREAPRETPSPLVEVKEMNPWPLPPDVEALLWPGPGWRAAR